MKTLGLLLTTAIVLPLTACMQRDRCDNGWCDGTSSSTVCFYDHDCGPGYRCEGGSCIAKVPVPVPPPRDIDAGAPGGATGSGGARVPDGGVGPGGAGGHGGAQATDAGPRGAGGAAQIDAGPGATGGSHAPDGGTVDTGHPVIDAGAPPSCGTDGGTTGGACHPHATPVCAFDNQCGLHGRCADGECQHACIANTDCGTGQNCSQGFCVTPPMSGGQCVFNADCGPHKTCINGYCHADCSADSDCGAGGQDHCVAGICQPNTGPQPQCRASADCTGVHVTEDVCVDAVCRTECVSDVDCCDGSSGSVCQMGYCVTAHEVAPQCHTNGDCGTGMTCIDAVCG